MILAQDFRSTVRALGLHDLAASISHGIEAGLDLVLPAATVQRLSEAIHLPQLVRSSLYTAVLVVGLFIAFATLELLTRSKGSQYRSWVFGQDVLYAFFYWGGFYAVTLGAAVANVLGTRLDFLKIEALAHLPAPLHYALYMLVVDCIVYWWHRLQHSSETLWAFHSVHHTQEEMTFISSFRLHPVEQMIQGLTLVVPALIMGVPTFAWLPIYAFMYFLEFAQHSALDWGYGKAYFLLVSPRFHAVHHSVDPRHHHRNFSKILSVWDFLFGTGLVVAERPVRFGVDGLPIPRSIFEQLMAPFRILLRRRALPGASVSPTRTPAAN